MTSIRALRTRLQTRLVGDSGFSLTEMIVSIVVLGILMSMVLGFFVSASRAFTSNQTVDGNSRTAANAMNEVSKVVRAATPNPLPDNTTAPAFVSATATSVVFYAYINLASSTEIPIEVQFSYNATAGTLTETRWAATAISGGLWSFPATTSTPTSTRILSTSVLTGTGVAPIFSYVASDNTDVALTAGSIATASLGSVAAVRVSLTVGRSTAAGQSTTLLNTIGCPNIPLARNPS